MAPLFTEKVNGTHNLMAGFHLDEELPLKIGLLMLSCVSLSLVLLLVFCAYKAGYLPFQKKNVEDTTLSKAGWLPLSQYPPPSEVSESETLDNDWNSTTASQITTLKDMDELVKHCNNKDMPEPPPLAPPPVRRSSKFTAVIGVMGGVSGFAGGSSANNSTGVRRLTNLRRASVPAFLPSEVIEELPSEEDMEAGEAWNINTRRNSRLSSLMGLVDLRRPSASLANSRRMSYSTGHLMDNLHDLDGDPVQPLNSDSPPRMSRRLSSFDANLMLSDFRPSLYANGSPATNAHGAGILRFSLDFSEKDNYFCIDLHECFLLLSQKPREKGRFYVKVRIHRNGESDQQSMGSLGESSASMDSLACAPVNRLSAFGRRDAPLTWKEQKSTSKLAYRTATFEEAFKFPSLNRSDLSGCVIQFIVKEVCGGIGGNNILVGTVTCALIEIMLESPLKLLLPNITRDICPPNQESVPSKGEVLISCSLDEKRQKLSIGLIQCRGIQLPEKVHACHWTASLMLGEDLVKNKGVDVNVQKLQQEPCSNNILTFKIPNYSSGLGSKKSTLNFIRRSTHNDARERDAETSGDGSPEDGQAAATSVVDFSSARLSVVLMLIANKSGSTNNRRFSTNNHRQCLLGKCIVGGQGIGTSPVATEQWTAAFNELGQLKVAWLNLL